MKYKKYIVSFFAGTSGRFVKILLDRIIRGSTDPIKICQYNSAHLNDTYTGISMFDQHLPNVYDILEYDPESSRDFKFSNILQTHTYPDFNTINSRFDDIGIILIKPSIEDMHEILFNGFYKNKKEVPSLAVLKTKSHNLRNRKHDYSFFQTIEYPKNCLILKYTDIYEKDSEKYRIIEILKEFTGITEIPMHLNAVCEQYISNRNRMINQYNLR